MKTYALLFAAIMRDRFSGRQGSYLNSFAPKIHSINRSKYEPHQGVKERARRLKRAKHNRINIKERKDNV